MVTRLGDMITIKNTIKDRDGNLTTPTSQVVYLYVPTLTVQTSGSSPSFVSTGVYTQSFTIPSTGSIGTWKVLWEAVIATGYKYECIDVPVITQLQPITSV